MKNRKELIFSKYLAIQFSITFVSANANDGIKVAYDYLVIKIEEL